MSSELTGQLGKMSLEALLGLGLFRLRTRFGLLAAGRELLMKELQGEIKALRKQLHDLGSV